MTATKFLARPLFVIIGLSLLLGAAQAQDCNGIDRTIVFAGLDWDSAQVHNEVAGYILQEGFGCEFTDIPGSTVPMIQGLVRGDIDINMEVWFNTVPEIYHEAVDSGDVLDLGRSMDAVELAFLVPRYVIEGDAERGIEPMAPDLQAVSDLPQYSSLFRDPEQPDKGRYYNCIIGWQCELINNDKFASYELGDSFTNFNPGTGVALAASLAASYEKGEPWLGYYWGPTWVLGTFDMVALDESDYSDACWTDGDRACDYPASIVNVAVSKEFADAASQEMLDFLSAFSLGTQRVSELLAFMQVNEVEASEATRHFLTNEPDVWSAWVSDEVADRVQASLE